MFYSYILFICVLIIDTQKLQLIKYIWHLLHTKQFVCPVEPIITDKKIIIMVTKESWETHEHALWGKFGTLNLEVWG